MSSGKKDSGALADLTAHASDPVAGSNRTFGIVFTIAFGVIAALPMLKGHPPRLWAAGVSAAFLVVALAVPAILGPLNQLWMQFGILLGRIVSPIVLFVLYVVAVVPTGIILRLRGKDPLRRAFDPNAASYWVHRVPPGKPDATMTRQF